MEVNWFEEIHKKIMLYSPSGVVGASVVGEVVCAAVIVGAPVVVDASVLFGADSVSTMHGNSI